LVENQVPVPIRWRGASIGNGFIADLIVEEKVIVEIKSIETINPVHYKQLLTYLRLSKKKLGLLINFKEALLKTEIKRVVNGLYIIRYLSLQSCVRWDYIVLS